MSKQKTGAEYIAESLKKYGVDHVFFIQAILRRTQVELEKVGIKRIVTHSEKAAAYMADGYARIAGKPGIAMAQSVGAANLAAGLQDPYLARSPVIAVTGRKEPIAQYRNAYQEIIHAPMFEPVTKYNVNVDSVEQLPYVIGQAFREATTGTPRPVHLDLLGLSGEKIEQERAIFPDYIIEDYTNYPAHRVEPDTTSIDQAVALLRKSKKPVIVAGGGVPASGAEEEIVRLSEALSIPVATSCDGKGVISDMHPLSVGVVGTYSAKCANRIVSEADVVLFIGCNTGDQVTFNWKLPKEGTQVIQIDIDPAEVGRNYISTAGICGDPKVCVQRLISEVGKIPPKEEWSRRAGAVVEEWRNEVESMRNSDAMPIAPERLCREIGDVLPENGILVSDTGYSAIWTSTMTDLHRPGQRYIRAAGSLGWAFPASLGAKCAAPDCPVVCFNGDGAFWYHIAELETALRWGIRTVTIVNNNSGFGQSRKGIDSAYGEDSGDREQVYTFKDINFAEIAHTIGCLGIRVESPENIAPAIRKALDSDVPAVVDVKTDVKATAPEVWDPS
jgi:acetolactate synthase-1/2/3 large subunit